MKPQFREFKPDVRTLSLHGIVAVGLWDGKDKDTFRGEFEPVELSCLPEMPTDQAKAEALLKAKHILLKRIKVKPGEVQLYLRGLLDEDEMKRLYTAH